MYCDFLKIELELLCSDLFKVTKAKQKNFDLHALIFDRYYGYHGSLFNSYGD